MKRVRYQRSDARSSFVISSSRDSFGTPSSEARACGAREARGATGNARPAAGHAVALDARKKPPGSTSRTARTRRRGDVANGRRARVVGIRESEGEASAEARLGEHVVVPHEQVADGHLGTRWIGRWRVKRSERSNESS